MVTEIADRSALRIIHFFRFEITRNLGEKNSFFNTFYLFDNIAAVQSCSSLFFCHD